jgi:hypothetical protein
VRTVCATQGVLLAKERKECEGVRRRRAREKEENRRWGQRVKESGRSMRRAGGIRRKSKRAVSFGDTVRPALVPVSATLRDQRPARGPRTRANYRFIG